MYQAKLLSRSEFPPLAPDRPRLHVRHWGREGAAKLFLLHGWMDSSITFQFLVDTLGDHWHFIAPDWRGFGQSQANTAGYYFPDYLADLDALLHHYAANETVTLIGHSMGGMVASLYAGIRPHKIEKLISIEGFGLPDSDPNEAPKRYRRWLDELQQPPRFDALSLTTVQQRLQRRNPLLSADRAAFLAHALTESDAVNDGYRYQADPRHKMVNPVLYRLGEAKACWREVTAPVLWVVGGGDSDHPLARSVLASLDERRACFQTIQQVTLNPCGHMVQWEQPEALAAAIEDFLAC